jgi:hypothetical protein
VFRAIKKIKGGNFSTKGGNFSTKGGNFSTKGGKILFYFFHL